jgi:hypothetical protein
MDVSFVAMTAIPAAAPSVDPYIVSKPHATATVTAATAHVADATAYNELQGYDTEGAK